MSTQTYTLHTGPLPTSLPSPALQFISLYVAKVESLDLSGPYHNWYSPTCVFYNADGTIYSGGEAIWSWMHQLFGSFEKVDHTLIKTWVLEGVEVGGRGKRGFSVDGLCY
jgi:hypothetical protein